MALLTNAAIQGYRDYTKRRIAYAKYKIGSTYYKTPIESVTTTSSGMLEILSSRNLPDMETADIKDIEYFRREWVIAFADLWWQLEQHLECWCVQREPEQSTFQLEHEHRLPLRSTLRCQNRKLQGLPTVRGDKGTCFHSG